MVRKDQVLHLIQSLETIPTLPCIALEATKIAIDQGSPAEDLTRIVEVDQVLTTRILKAANGAAYGRPGTVTRLPDAIRLLGPHSLRSIVLSVSVMDVFSDRMGDYGIDPVNLWLHSITTAVYARALSSYVESLDPEEAFIAGLLHDIGKILMCISFEGGYPLVVSMAAQDQIPLHRAESAEFGYDHAEVGRWLLDRWNLPLIYGDSILQHHHPVEAAFPDTRHYLLACLVALANHLSYKQGNGSGGDPGKAFISPHVVASLGLPKEIMEQTDKEAALQIRELAHRVNLKPVPLNAYHSILKHAHRVLSEIHQDREVAHYVLLQKEKELRGINTIGLALQSCTTPESAVKVVAEGLLSPFSFTRVICTVFHDDHWEYRADAVSEGEEWICQTQLRGKSPHEQGLPEPDGPHPWIHVDLIGKERLLGYLKVKPGTQCTIPLEKLGLLLASCAKLVAEALERIEAHQRIQLLSEDLMASVSRLDKEKEKVESEKIEKQSILTGIPLGLLLLNKEGTISFCNAAAEELLYADKPLTGKEIHHLFRDPELAKGIGTGLRGSQSITRESSMPGSDPLTMKTIRWRLVPVPNGDVTAGRLLLIMEDITKEKDLQRQIIQSARMASIGELATGTAHNLRSPLGAVKGILELILEEIDSGHIKITYTPQAEEPPIDTVADQLKVATRSLGKCFSVIDDLLDYSRTKDHSPEILRLHELLEGTETFLGELFVERNIQIEKDIQADTLFGRKADLMQVFLNIYSNAYKAMPQGGRLTIQSRVLTTTQTTRPFVEILLMDTGHGIAPEHLPRIFDPTFTTAEGAGGTGLGLSLAHKIVRNHGGGMDVESRVGEGTTFVLRLPTGPDASLTHYA